MALKHSVAAPSGVTLTGCLIHRVVTTTKDIFFESKSSAGRFVAGKSIEKQTEIEISGDCESSAALPAVGSGANTAASPKVDEATLTDLNEKAGEFSVKVRYTADGAGAY